ncbi:alpha/beta hydrolase [Pelovirga terrestris]|uniref:Alpha/beta hydrolase n=1 Tax=Pelovirga terrestris TaxID=2771352 RepID=A0A8J6URN5_9BACT|nr:alpha/beta hydrolase-fold protein [Pelovirga terrestris]MBD1401626.1 alpha/beta hydrolase [Pelovirga terrestris]
MSSNLLTIEDFPSRALQSSRRIRILLPHDYRVTAARRYPVLYAHDGQNLFADSESFSGQGWHLDRILGDLIGSGQIEPLILVAIDHAGSGRLAEFAHQDRIHDGQFISARGSRYEEFLAAELKPHIDHLFLTRPEPRANVLMGSSMGGLVSLNIGLRRSHLFGAIAALSPSCWWNPDSFKADLRQYQAALSGLKIWLDIGGREGRYGDDVEEIAAYIAQLSEHDEKMLRYDLDPAADHSERAWRNRVHLPLKFLFGVNRK